MHGYDDYQADFHDDDLHLKEFILYSIYRDEFNDEDPDEEDDHDAGDSDDPFDGDSSPPGIESLFGDSSAEKGGGVR